MRRFEMVCAVVLTTLSAGNAAKAMALWQQTYAADPAGVTSVSSDLGPLPLQDLYLRVSGGAFDTVGWTSWYSYGRLWWEDIPGLGWLLTGNEYIGGEAGVAHTGPKLSFFEAIPLPTFDFCDDPAAKAPGQPTCAQFDRGSSVVFSGAQVFATDDFTLTLSDQPLAAIPEPSVWALMILGFGGLGVAVRRARGSASARTRG